MARRAALGLLLAAAAAYGIQAARTGMWPFDSQRKGLAQVLGGEAPGWLKDAEVASWQPDPDSKAQRWFASAPLAREAFVAWAAAGGLALLRDEHLPASVWVLPEGVQLAHWTGTPPGAGELVEAKGMGANATLWARWNAGRLYLVAYPGG